jgi:membrane-bound ClpP family serine protease
VVWLIGAVLVVMVVGASATGAHAGPHSLVGIALAWVAAIGWWVAAAAIGGTSATAWVLAGVAGGLSAVSIALALPALRVRQLPPPAEGGPAPGDPGRAVTELDPVGVVQLNSESWTAESVNGTVPAGSEVRVVSSDGVRLRVWSDHAAASAEVPQLEGN